MAFKVLLIQANSPMDTLIPPNLATISACLKEEGIDVRLFDTTFYRTRDVTGDDARVETLQVKETDFSEFGIEYNEGSMITDFVHRYLLFNPNLIGLSAVSLTYPHGLRLLKSVRDFGTPTIVGGVHATVCALEVIKEQCVDYVCVGEGEEALVELCKKLENGEDTTNIRNIWAKKNGKIIPNPVRPPIDINKLPFQDWSIFEKRRRYKPMGGKIRATMCCELARFCPMNCWYCTNEFYHKLYKNKNYREKDIDNFINEVKYLKEKYDVKYLYISAESFLVTKKERFEEFIEKYKKIGLPFWMETRPESVTDEKIKKLKSVGCESMNIGIESGDPELRVNLLNRRMTDKQIIDAVQIIKKHEIRIGANNIIGFPTETREQIFKTIELNRKANPDSIMIHPFNPYYGTKLYDMCVEKGYIDKNEHGGDYRIDYILKQEQMSKKELMGLYRTFAMYTKFPKDRWNEIKKAESNDAVFEKLSDEYRKEYLV